MNIENIITMKLSALKPQYLKLVNNSILHQGHNSSPNNGNSHFALEIRSALIEGRSLIEQHRIINNLLKEEFNNGLHALSIKIM